MKQTTLILLGLGVVIVLVAVWVYLLFFTNRGTDPIFSDLSLGGEEDGGIMIPPTPVEETPTEETTRPRLRQLTTRPVIGFVEVQSTTTDPIMMYYAEAGTGHIYTLNINSNTEDRLSNTTVAEASVATFSPDAKTVAIRARNDRRAGEIELISLDTKFSTRNHTLPATAYDFTLQSSSSLLYTTKEETGLVAHRYLLDTKNSSTLFTVPFFEATVAWGSTVNTPHVVYPKPSYLLEGYLYTFTGGTMRRLPASGYGLTAINGDAYITYTATKDATPSTHIYNVETGDRMPSPITMLPDKCVPSKRSSITIWCGYEDIKATFEFPDHWYRGLVSYKDSLWKVDLEQGSAEFLVDTFLESGREIDITAMSIGKSETALYFINKNDNTLWMYEL